MKKISAPMMMVGLGLLAGIGLIYFTIDNNKTPSYSNDPERIALAQCLSENGVKMFGAYWCPHCANQKALFGPGWEHVTYVECAIQGAARNQQTEACREAGIQSYPTWELADGTRFTGEQSLARLAREANCPYGTAALDADPDDEAGNSSNIETQEEDAAELAPDEEVSGNQEE